MTKHTPGPWWVCQELDGYVQCRFTWVRDQFGLQIASTYNQTRAELQAPLIEAVANARLIAAAPDLLEALKLAHDHLCVSPGYEGSKEIAQIRAALDKAEGR